MAKQLQFDGSHYIDMPRDEAWEALNDPTTLRDCIRSCDEVIRHDETHYTAIFLLHFGPLKRQLEADLQVENALPPERYRLRATVHSPVAGEVHGTADVELTDEEDGTRLVYRADVEAQGWFAGLGTRLLGGAADRYMTRFFERFAARLAEH